LDETINIIKKNADALLDVMNCECVDWINLVGSCEQGNEPSGSITDGEFVD
jgi:hypothetical protein